MALFKIFNNIDSRGELPSTYTKGYMYFDAVKGIFYIDTAGEGGTTGTRMAVNAWGAQKAYADENDDRISTTYIKDADYGSLLADLSIARKIDGLTFDYTKDISRYGVCSTGSGIPTKTVSIPDVTALTTGLTVYVKFDNTNVAANPLLQINELTAASILSYDNNNPWSAGQVLGFVYDGTGWREIGLSSVSRLNHSLTFGNGTFVYDGSADVTVPLYDGTYSVS